MVPRALNRGSSRGGLLRRFEVSKPTHPFDIAAMNAVPIDHDFLLHTASTLVGIDSRNPELEAGAPGEREIAEYVAGVLTGFDGWQVELQALEDRRANVVAVRPGAAETVSGILADAGLPAEPVGRLAPVDEDLPRISVA